jgi:hypothetical protein
LLQVWSDQGVLFYERKLVNKPYAFFMVGKVLILKEEASSDDVYVVKCSLKHSPTLFRVVIPLSSLFEGATAEKVVYGFADNHILCAVGQKLFYVDISA